MPAPALADPAPEALSERTGVRIDEEDTPYLTTPSPSADFLVAHTVSAVRRTRSTIAGAGLPTTCGSSVQRLNHAEATRSRRTAPTGSY